MIRQVLFITLLIGCVPSHGVQNDINLDVYQELCGFIQTLETKPEFSKITFEPSDETSAAFSVSELLLAIESLNVSTADDDVFDRLAQGEKFEKASENPVVANYIGKKVWGWLLNAWGKNQSFVQGAFLQSSNRPPYFKARARAHRQIGKLVTMAWMSARQLLATREIMENNAYLARMHMYSAIYGANAVAKWISPDGLPEPSDDILYGNDTSTVAAISAAEIFGPSDKLDFLNMDYFSKVTLQTDSFGDGQGTYARVCGGAGTAGTYPGTSIISDMTCLCLTGEDDEDNGQYCGDTVGHGLDVSVDFNKDKLPYAGAILQVTCGLYMTNATKVKPTPAALHAIVTRLMGMLGKKGVTTRSYSYSNGYSYGSSEGSSSTGTSNQNFARFILGAFVSDNSAVQCDGTSDSASDLSSGGNCVNYASFLASGQEIPWIAEVKQAAEKLKENERLYTRQLSLLTQMETFVKMAVSSFNDAWEEPDENAPTSLPDPNIASSDAPDQQTPAAPPDTTAWSQTPDAPPSPAPVPAQAPTSTPQPPVPGPPATSPTISPPPAEPLPNHHQRATQQSLIPVFLLVLGGVIF